MKKSSKRSSAAKSRQPSKPAEAQKSKTRTRREALLFARDWGVVAALGAGGLWWLVDDVRADMAEHDLTKVGDGVPSIVQIHDPNCGMCTALQREVRTALKDFDEAQLRYLVANIRTAEGRSFANRYGVQHVTLLLFDGGGQRLQTLTGVQDAKLLKTAFQRHLARSKRALS